MDIKDYLWLLKRAGKMQKDEYLKICIHDDGSGQVTNDSDTVIVDFNDLDNLESCLIQLGQEDAPLEAAAPDLLRELHGLLDDIVGLIEESAGVYGLHLNGDVSPWSELVQGGRFERLLHIRSAIEVIAKATKKGNNRD